MAADVPWMWVEEGFSGGGGNVPSKLSVIARAQGKDRG